MLFFPSHCSSPATVHLGVRWVPYSAFLFSKVTSKFCGASAAQLDLTPFGVDPISAENSGLVFSKLGLLKKFLAKHPKQIALTNVSWLSLRASLQFTAKMCIQTTKCNRRHKLYFTHLKRHLERRLRISGS